MHGLTEKWHGLPKWAWAAIVAGVIFIIYLWYRNRNSSSNATPLDAGQAADNSASDMGNGSGSGGSAGDSGSGFPFGGSYTPPPNNPIPITISLTPNPSTPPPPEVISNPPPPQLPIPPTSTSPPPTKSPTKPSTKVSKSILVPKNATATSLQTTVAKVGPSGVLVPGTHKVALETQHPAAVKVTANRGGASANKAQGVFSIH